MVVYASALVFRDIAWLCNQQLSTPYSWLLLLTTTDIRLSVRGARAYVSQYIVLGPSMSIAVSLSVTMAYFRPGEHTTE